MTINKMTTKNLPQSFEEYAKAHYNITDLKSYCKWNWIGCYYKRQSWETSGRVTQWYEKGDSGCVVKRAVVRGDGKVMGEVDQVDVDCSRCSHFAAVNDGFLRGVELFGIYEYKKSSA